MAEQPPRRRDTVARWLVVMAREPRAGSVKTRLARDIGEVRALRFYRVMLDVLGSRLAGDGRWLTLFAVTPDVSVTAGCWPRDVPRRTQGHGDLGTRLHRVFERLPPGPVVIVGTDIPGITRAHIARAFRRLGASDAVLGPAGDGGYWLVGLRRTPRVRQIFRGVRWSSEDTLADTLANLAGARVTLLDRLDDVDDGESFKRLATVASRVVIAPTAVR